MKNEKTLHALWGYIDEPDLEMALNMLRGYLPDKYKFINSANYREEKLSVINDVVNRLNFCSIISMNKASKALSSHQESLIVYLFLTCFDRLGQSSNWKDFKRWLESKKNPAKKEKNDIQNKLKNISDSFEISKVIFNHYNEIYGVRTAFNNFLHEILPENSRRSLLNCIDIKKGKKTSKLNEMKTDDDKKKEIYLYNIRNDYTHKGKERMFGGISKYERDLLPEECWEVSEQTFSEKKWTNVCVKHWPEILDRTARIGLRSFIEQILKDLIQDKNELNSKYKSSFKSRNHFYICVTSLIPYITIKWKIVFEENYSINKLIRNIASGINAQCPIRRIHSAGYGLDWILKDSASGRYFDNISINSNENQNNQTLYNVGFNPGMELEIVDSASRFHNPFSQHIYKKHAMKDGSHKVAEYRSDGSYRFVSEYHKGYQKYKAEGYVPEKIPFHPLSE